MQRTCCASANVRREALTVSSTYCVAAFELRNLPVQSLAEFQAFCLTMEEWYTDNWGTRRPFILDYSLCCHVYKETCVLLASGRQLCSKLQFAIKALELAGKPPLQYDHPLGDVQDAFD